ncbi:MAG: universal stress protein [Actinomycetota bacterium]|nr:universal stress protein [Actinomycetota bacterium]
MTDIIPPPVVVGVDGSSESRVALAWAVEEATRRKRTLHLLCAWHSDYAAETTAPMVPSIEDDCRSILDAAFEDARTLSPGIQVRTATVHAQAAAALIAASRHADTVVVGSRGRGAVKEALAGSTSMQLAAYGSCPVVVVRETSSRAELTQRVVVGVDGSDLSTEAAGYAFEEAAQRGCGLTVLHAWDTTVYSSSLAMSVLVDTWTDLEVEQDVITSAAIAGWTQKYPDVDVRTHVIQGPPADILVDASVGAELVVVGSRGRGGFKGLLLGSVSRTVLHRAHCPVAVIRPHQHDDSHS